VVLIFFWGGGIDLPKIGDLKDKSAERKKIHQNNNTHKYPYLTYGLMMIINKTLDRSMYTFVGEQNLNMSINHELNTVHVSNYKHGGCYIFHVVSTNISSVFNKAVRILTAGINHRTVSLNYTGLVLIINLQTGLMQVSLYRHLKEQN